MVINKVIKTSEFRRNSLLQKLQGFHPAHQPIQLVGNLRKLLRISPSDLLRYFTLVILRANSNHELTLGHLEEIDFLLQLRRLFLRIDHAFEQEVDLAQVRNRNNGATGRNRPIHLNLRAVSERFHERRVLLQRRFQRAVALQKRFRFRFVQQVVVAASRTDPPYYFLGEIHVVLDGFVPPVFHRLRVGHDGYCGFFQGDVAYGVEALVQFFCYEGHEGGEEAHGAFERSEEGYFCRAGFRGVFGCKHFFEVFLRTGNIIKP